MSPITKTQLTKILKAAAYLGISSVISGVVALIAQDPRVFGALTPIVNLALVSLKQLFTQE